MTDIVQKLRDYTPLKLKQGQRDAIYKNISGRQYLFDIIMIQHADIPHDLIETVAEQLENEKELFANFYKVKYMEPCGIKSLACAEKTANELLVEFRGGGSE
jgi:hypothetical protein